MKPKPDITEKNERERRERVLEATREYLSSNAKPPKKARRAPRERRLF